MSDITDSYNEEKQKQEQERSAANQQVRDFAKTQGKKLDRKAKRAGKKALKAAVKTGGATLGGIIIMVLVALFMIIGIIAFVITTPGLITNRLMQIGDNMFKGAKVFLFGDNGKLNEVSHEQKLELLNYINDMGLDVVGYGFVPQAEMEEDEDGNQKVRDFNEYLDVANGGGKNRVNRLTIFRYLVGANRAFTINNSGLIGDVIDRENNHGMITIYGDGAGIEATINEEQKTLEVTSNNVSHWGAEDGFSYSLEGWTGRYGTPIEFILSLHLATMSSGFVEELLTNPDIKTNVDIELNKVDCKVDFKIKKGNDEIQFDNNVDLYNKYISGQEIKKEDISVVGIINLITKTQNEFSSKEKFSEEEQREYLGTYYFYNGLQKNIDAMKAITGNGKFAVSNSNSFFTLNNDGNYFSGNYLCSLNDDGSFNANTGILATKVPTYQGETKQLYEYVAVGNGDYDMYINNVTSGQYYLSITHNDNYNWFELEGLSQKNAMSLATLVIKASAPYPTDNNYEEFMADLKQCVVLEEGNLNNKLYQIQRQRFAGRDAEYKAFTDLVGYAKVFRQIDNFIVGYVTCNMCKSDTNGTIPKSEIDHYKQYFYYDFEEYAYQGNELQAGYYTGNFIECCNKVLTELDNVPFNIFYNEGGLLKQLSIDCTSIENHFMSNNDKIVTEILNKVGYTDFNVEEIYKVYYMLNLDIKDANWVEARITRVIKHWYKDISFSDAYTEKTQAKEMPYDGEPSGLSDEFEVITLLTPNSGEKYYEQTDEPYVVKGDMVYLDNKYEGDVQDVTDKLGDTGDSSYNWGDGYRATKKIFTQGFYYCYDGSEHTSSSIYYQEEIIEKMTNETYVVRVENGRIVAMPADDIPNEENEVVYNKNGIKIVKLKTNEGGVSSNYSDETVENEDKKIEIKPTTVWYKIYANNSNQPLKYLSPALGQATYEEAKSRVEQINEVWDSMEVTVKRKPLSFDNTGAEGTMMASTAFSILENCKSEDAEYVYRDLKELLIDLGYFTKAEFDYLSTDVLKWFIPAYRPQSWPMNREEDYMEYGVFVYPYEEIEEEAGETENDQVESDEEVEINTDLLKKEDTGFQPDLDIIAPGTCIITEADSTEITIKFNGVEDPKIGILNDYIMRIKGLDVADEIKLADSQGDLTELTVSIQAAIDNKTVIPVGSVIGKTGTEKIQVIMINNRQAYINNVEDYMHVPVGKLYTGELSEEFYYYLGVVLEGMKYTDEDYFTHENGNVNNLGDSIYVTVGPGLLMDDGKMQKYIELGGESVDNKSLSSKFRKDIILEMYVYYVDTVFKASVEEYLDGYKLEQHQVEALTLSAYQLGNRSAKLITRIERIKSGASADSLRSTWVTDYKNLEGKILPGVRARRYVEWYLYTYGKYISTSNSENTAYPGKDVEWNFKSDTPYTDFLNGD